MKNVNWLRKSIEALKEGLLVEPSQISNLAGGKTIQDNYIGLILLRRNFNKSA